MQKAILVCGTLEKVFGNTVAEVINEMLEMNPGYKLTQTTLLNSSDISCTLLCVLEDDGNQKRTEKQTER